MITIALVGVSACEEVVISSILDRLMWGCPRAPCDPGLVVQGVAALGTEGCDVPLAQATGVDITDNCMVLDECCEGSAVTARAIGILMAPPRQEARDQGRKQ